MAIFVGFVSGRGYDGKRYRDRYPVRATDVIAARASLELAKLDGEHIIYVGPLEEKNASNKQEA